MERLEARLASDYRIRTGLLVGVCALIAMPLCLMALRRGLWWLWLFAVTPLAAVVGLSWRNYRRSILQFDEEGVLLRDGRRHAWSDYIEQREVTFANKFGATATSHTELHFRDGVVPIFPALYDNLRDIYSFLRAADAAAAKQRSASDSGEAATAAALPAPTDPAQPSPAMTLVATASGPCAICAELGNYSHAMQKVGREEEDTFLPAAAGRMVRIKEVRPGANRTPVLERCPGCGDFFLYEIVYEYLATGSEDEQIMTRLSQNDAQRYLDGWNGRSEKH